MVTGNSLVSPGGGGEGGGIRNSGTLKIYSSTIAGNYAPYNGGGVLVDGVAGGSLEMTNSIIWDNSEIQLVAIPGPYTINYSDIEGGGFSGIGNIDADPQFVWSDPATDGVAKTTGDYRIQPDSGAREVGGGPADIEPDPPIVDIEGDSRPYPPDNGSYDMGADEYTDPDSLLTSNPTVVRLDYAYQDEDGVVMEHFQVDSTNTSDGTCELVSITVEDLGTASTDDWDSIEVYIDTDTVFTDSVKIGELASWDGTSGVIGLNLGTVDDRTVTNGTPKYVFIVYNLSSAIGFDETVQAWVTAVGVASPDSGGVLAYDSDVVTVKSPLIVRQDGLGDHTTIQAAINDSESALRPIIVYEGRQGRPQDRFSLGSRSHHHIEFQRRYCADSGG
jgi:hypothetical protein